MQVVDNTTIDEQAPVITCRLNLLFYDITSGKQSAVTIELLLNRAEPIEEQLYSLPGVLLYDLIATHHIPDIENKRLVLYTCLTDITKEDTQELATGTLDAPLTQLQEGLESCLKRTEGSNANN